MDITFKDLIRLWGKPCSQKEINHDLPIGRISTDSRTIEKGDFFVPLIGLSLIHISEPTRPY